MINKRICSVFIDGKPYHFDVKGVFSWGDDEILYCKESSPIKNASWESQGYTVEEILTEEEFKQLYESVVLNIRKALLNAGLSEEELIDFNIEKYHTYVKEEDLHNKIIHQTRELRDRDFLFDLEKLVTKISHKINCKLTHVVKDFGRTHVQIRINRPNSLDINPPHRDAYLDFFKDVLNVWVPICGSNHLSSLPLIPESHKFNENQILRTKSKGAEINGNVYNVPCLLTTKSGDFKMIRPNPKLGEALLFTPNLIHGSAVNLNTDMTRISLEFRFSKEH